MPSRPGASPPSPASVAHAARSLRKAVATALRRARRKADKLEHELAACEEAARWREDGELIKANLGRVSRGMSLVTLPDPRRPGTSRTLELVPHLKPMDNARRCFKRYRKLRRGREHLLAQVRTCERELRLLTELHGGIQQWIADGEERREALPHLPVELDNVRMDDLREFCSRARALRVPLPDLGALAGQPAAPAGPTADKGVRRFRSADGMPILVGKNARDNDRLSLHLARGNDWWFHVAHGTGSHVLVRGTAESGRVPRGRGRGTRPAMCLPQETLLDAATLAVHFSRSRRASRAEVHYTQAKHVRKRKHAPAGQVTLGEHKTLLLRMEPSRLQRLLRGDQRKA